MLLMCLSIFFARILDVSIGTVRTILLVKGKKKITALLAFIEVLIWFFIASEALTNVGNSLLIPISYAGGFACGTYLGSIVIDKFINGFLGVQVITKKDNDELIDNLRTSGFGVSVVNLKKEKTTDKKDMLFIELKKRSLDKLITIIKIYDKKAFIVVNERKFVQNGIIK